MSHKCFRACFAAALVFAAGVLSGGDWASRSAARQAKAGKDGGPADGGLSQLAPKEEAPPDDRLFVWPLPERGRQTLLVLRVIDGDTLECAYLVPAAFKLNGVAAPDPGGAEGKKAAEELTRVAGGRLLSASLKGRDKFGRVRADFWLGKPGDDAKAPSGWATKHLLKAKLVKPEK